MRVICTAQRALSVFDVLLRILVFRGRTLTCHSPFTTSCALYLISRYLGYLCFYICFLLLFSCFPIGLLRLSPPLPHQYDRTPLHNACREGHLEVARALMDNGADLGAKNNVSPYALPPYSHRACCWDVYLWMCLVFVWLLVVPVVR